MTTGGSLTLAPNGAMSRSRKAAMVVQMMLAEGQKIALDNLPEDVQLQLTHEIAALRMVDKATLASVAIEFAKELDAVGLALPGGVEAALSALDGQISPSAIARFREETAKAKGGGDPWKRILELESEDILDIMDTESIEVCGVVLSKLPVARAAEILGLLPGDQARRTAIAVSQTSQITPTAVQRIGAALAEQYLTEIVPAFAVAPGARVGAILNSSQSNLREQVLAGLGEEVPEFAIEVRKNIFTFPDIATRLQPTDVAKVIRVVDNDEFVTALAYSKSESDASAASVTFMLENMSKRMGAQLEEEMEERGKIKPADGESAQASVITALRDCADRGEITLIEIEEDEEE